MNDSAEVCLHHLFERQAAQTPEQIALVMDECAWRYGELNQRANQLAHALRALGVGDETPVGFCLPRSPEAVIAMLGIMKAGGAYVPLDPDLPAARKQYMVADAGCAVIITTATLRSALPPFAGPILDINAAALAQQPACNPDLPMRATALLYILYTSGSTGQPKGVCGLHSATLNRFTWMWRAYPFQADEVCCHKTTLSFVDAVWELFGALLQGIKVVILPQAASADPAALLALLAAAQVTRLILVPSLLQTLLQTDPALGNRLPALILWTVSGEPLTQALVDGFRARVPNGTLLNLYGSTEVAGDVTWAEFSRANAQTDTGVPIGRPIANAEVYILDDQMQPVAPGAIGELWVGGPVLARGYHHKPHETQARFFPNPFSGQGMLFKTGDLVTSTADGLLYYVGRVDNQVKIRGFRVELEEVEKVLAQGHPAPTQVAVVVQQATVTAPKRLVAFVTPASIDPRALQAYARAHLPAYMAPATIIALDQLPLTPTGKMDRQALAQWRDWRAHALTPAQQPQTPTEQWIAAQWAQLLQLPAVSKEDHFFDLGGDSLSAITLLEAIRAATGVRLPLADFLQQPTLAALATYMDAAEPHTAVSQPPANAYKLVRLTDRYLAQTIALVTDSFLNKGPLEIGLDIQPAAFAHFAEQVCQQALAAGCSYLAVDEQSEVVVGFCLCEDFVDYLAYHFTPTPTMAPIFALLEALDQWYIDQCGPIPRGAIFHIFMSGAAATAEGAGIVLALEANVLTMATSLQYKTAVTTCTHQVTTYIAQELAFQRKYALPYASFIHEGHPVFAHLAGPHHEAVLFEKVLNPMAAIAAQAGGDAINERKLR